ncbi:type II secretion system F family protein [Orbus sturtevantii]|uniref:type II secretion system F family protein n=1 Tax=Orbus sturtevantii TaxID=3074109 RepID=UPI00370D157E
MTLILAVILICASMVSLLSLRRKQGRLHIFNKITTQKKIFSSMVESSTQKDKELFRENVNKSLIGNIKKNYYLIMNSSTDRIKLLGIITLSIIVSYIVNKLYFDLNPYAILLASFIVTIMTLLVIKKRRLKKYFYENFPEALNMILGVVSSGASVSAGFKECAEKLEGTIGLTMKEICNRLDVGENPHNVLLNSYRHLPFPEYYFFILTIMVNLDGGGELKEVLSRLSKMLTNNRILAKTRDSKTAELRMTVMILGAMPGLFILLLRFISKENFEYLMDTEGGHVILYYTVASVSFGVLLIRTMINKII